MSYEPTNWQAGDIVTSAKLNKMEQGITNNARDIFIINNNDGLLDKTAGEIETAVESGIICYLLESQDNAKQYEILTYFIIIRIMKKKVIRLNFRNLIYMNSQLMAVMNILQEFIRVKLNKQLR